MESWTKDQLSMFGLMNCESSHSATSSQVAVDGHTPCALQDGQTIDPCGRDHVHANHLAQQENKEEKKTKDTCGLSGSTLSASADLQRSLESKLQDLLNSDGGMMLQTTWKMRNTPQLRQFLTIELSAQSMKDKGFTFFATPTVVMPLEKIEPTHRIRVLKSGRPRKTSKKGGEGSLNWAQEMMWRGLAPTAKLCAFFMGYPTEWERCADTVTRSSRKSRPRSSKPPCK